MLAMVLTTKITNQNQCSTAFSMRKHFGIS
jgi:hypothetical protein